MIQKGHVYHGEQPHNRLSTDVARLESKPARRTSSLEKVSKEISKLQLGTANTNAQKPLEKHRVPSHRINPNQLAPAGTQGRNTSRIHQHDLEPLLEDKEVNPNRIRRNSNFPDDRLDWRKAIDNTRDLHS